MRSRSPAFPLLLAAVAVAGPADARHENKERRTFDAHPITARWRVTGGGSPNSFDTRLAYSPTGLVGGSIQAEDDLGLDEETDTLALAAQYRLSRRHRLQATITDLDRTATRWITKQIEWGDVTYDVGAVIDSRLRTSLFRFKWKYSFSDGGRLDAGLSAGLSTFGIEASLSGEGSVDDGMGGTVLRGTTEGATFIAPVPLIGFWVDYAFSPRWIVRTSAESIDLSIGANSGRVLETEFTAEYYVSRLVGLGFGLTGYDLEYSKDEEDQRIGVNYRVKSLAGYLSFVF
jgi:hypothetical protein